MPKPKAKPTPKGKPGGPITTKKELAEALKLHASQITRYTLHHPEWKWSRSGPWNRADVPAMIRWRADTIEEAAESIAADAGDPNALASLRKERLRQDIRRLRAAADAMELEFARAKDLLMPTAHVVRVVSKLILATRNQLLALPSAVGPGLVGKQAGEIIMELDARLRDAMHLLSDTDPTTLLGTDDADEANQGQAPQPQTD